MAKPPSYDDIVRKTVPEPDSSWRPTPEQVQQAREGFRALDADEQALQTRVQAALGPDAAGVTVEITGDRVTLRGAVADTATLNRLPEVVRGIRGVASVDDQLVVRAG